MKFNDPGIQPGLVVAIEREMALVAPVRELVDDGIIQRVVDLPERSLLRVDVRGAELAGRVAAVDRLDVDNVRLRHFRAVHEVVHILFLCLAPGEELQFQVGVAREIRKMRPRVPPEFSHKAVDLNRHAGSFFTLFL